MRVRIAVTSIVLSVCVWLLGCTDAAKLPLDRISPDQARDLAQRMTVEQLTARVKAYVLEIRGKKVEQAKIGADLAALNPQAAPVAEAEKLKTRQAEVGKTLAALVERYQIFFNQLKRRGAKTDDLRID